MTAIPINNIQYILLSFFWLKIHLLFHKNHARAYLLGRIKKVCQIDGENVNNVILLFKNIYPEEIKNRFLKYFI
jgi:hypothetical protein